MEINEFMKEPYSENSSANLRDLSLRLSIYPDCKNLTGIRLRLRHYLVFRGQTYKHEYKRI